MVNSSIKLVIYFFGWLSVLWMFKLRLSRLWIIYCCSGFICFNLSLVFSKIQHNFEASVSNFPFTKTKSQRSTQIEYLQIEFCFNWGCLKYCLILIKISSNWWKRFWIFLHSNNPIVNFLISQKLRIQRVTSNR